MELIRLKCDFENGIDIDVEVHDNEGGGVWRFEIRMKDIDEIFGIF